jgi:hypothetical protein
VSSYTALAADLTGEFCVTATRDNTMLTVTTSPSLRSCDTTQTIYRTLQRGETFVYAAPFIKGQACDPSGMIIRTSAPVSVISGHACAYVPAGNPACNPLYEQLRPIPTLSTTYFIPPIAGRSESMVRIMAPSEPATIKLSNVPDVTIAPSQWYEGRRDASAMLVKSTAPVQVALYSLGYRAGDSVGDPSMIMVPDVNSYAHELMIGTVGTDDWENTITVMCLPNTSNDVRVDGTPVPSSSFITDEASHFRYAHVPVSKGTHIITSAYPIGVMCTGIGVKTNQYDAYGHAGATVLQK